MLLCWIFVYIRLHVKRFIKQQSMRMSENVAGNARHRHLKFEGVPVLPHNKDFHLFVCYVNENAKEVNTIVRNLEKKFKLTCFYHERDFKPGEKVLNNIHEGIKRSMYMLVVLTQNFVKSNMCNYEVGEALNMAIDSDYMLIPVKLEPCERPGIIKNISYIDAENEGIEHVHVRIMEAILKNEIQKEEKKRNGEILSFPVQTYKIGRWSFSRFKVQFDEKDRRTIRNKGFDISEEILDDVQKIVNDSFVVRYKHVYENLNWIVSIIAGMLILIAMICFLVLLVTTSRSSPADGFPVAAFVLIGIIPLLLIVWSVCACCACYGKNVALYKPDRCFIREFRRLNYSLWEKTRQIKGKYRLFVFYNLKSASLKILKYNLQPCRDCFLRKLEHNKVLLKYRRSSENNKEYADRLFRTFCRYYLHLLLEAVPNNERRKGHDLVTNSKCMCLLLEDQIEDISMFLAQSLLSFCVYK